MLRNEFITNIRISLINAPRCLNRNCYIHWMYFKPHKRGGNIRSENVMLLMAVSNARRENVIWNFPRRNAHFSSLEVRNAWKRSRNSAMWRSHTSATRVCSFSFLWKRGNINPQRAAPPWISKTRFSLGAERRLRDINVLYRSFHRRWYFRTWIIS